MMHEMSIVQKVIAALMADIVKIRMTTGQGLRSLGMDRIDRVLVDIGDRFPYSRATALYGAMLAFRSSCWNGSGPCR
jgi:hypothetical protein